jgi:colanic acid biosynthesis glycosyl transferase WcaI
MIEFKHKTVLLVSPFFYPELISTGKYNTCLVRSLLNENISVKVIASYPIYPDWKPKDTLETIEEVELYRGGLFIKYPKNPIFRRLILELWFSIFSLYRFLRIRKEIDVIVPVFPPSLFFALISFFIPKNVKVFGIVHDLQGVYAEKSERVFSKIIAFFINLIEKRAFRACHHLIFLSNTMVERAKKAYKLEFSEVKISVQYPFFNIIDSETQHTEISKLFTPEFKHVVYSGALGEKQNPLQLLSFFEALVNRCDKFHCHIFSRGPSFDSLRNLIDTSFNSTIYFHDLVPEDCLSELYKHSFVQILPQAPQTSDGSLPSKLPNLIYSGTPIFSISDSKSELSEILFKSGIGFSAHSWDNELLVEQFLEYANSLEGLNRRDLAIIGREYSKVNFNISHLISTILS